MEETHIKLSVPLSEDVIKLSAMDQQIMRTYPKITIIFELDKATKVDVIRHLKQGLAAALSEIPDFAATIVPVPGSQRKELELRLGPEAGVQFRVVDQTQNDAWTYGSYSELAEKHFPTADIPQDVLFPPEATPEDRCSDGIPAMFIQANLINGGLIIGVVWHHSVSDARGLNVFADSWARHTKTSIIEGKPGPPVMPAEATRERWRLDHGFRDATIDQIPDYVVDSSIREPPASQGAHLLDRQHLVTVPYAVSTWYLSASSLKSLRKTLAEAETDKAAQFTQVEAVSALVWKHVSIARQLDKIYPEGSSLFTTRLDFRARTKPTFHDDFIGNINEPNARVRVPLGEVCAVSTPASLVTLAEAIRVATETTGESAVRALIGLINGLQAVTDVTWNYNHFPGPDFGVTDLSQMDSLSKNWGGPLGHPSSVRSYSRETGLLYLFPQDREGGFEIQVQCELEAVERLKQDPVFMRYCGFRRISLYNQIAPAPRSPPPDFVAPRLTPFASILLFFLVAMIWSSLG